MKKMLAILGLSLVAFATAFGASLYLRQTPPATVEHTTEQGVSVVAQGNETDAEHGDHATESTHDTHSPGVSANEALPAAVRPRTASVEELVRLGLSLNEREKQLNLREEQLEKQALHQQLALADIASEEQKLNGLRTAIDGHLDTAEKLIGEMQSLQQEAAQEREQLQQSQTSVPTEPDAQGASRDANIKRLAQWLQGMEATKGAELLREMANDGQTDTAVQILSHFEEREAAKLLSAIEDTTLLNELVTKFRDMKTSKPARE